MIKAPFNFVPLSDDVFFPDWADQISQDIPFEDGLSGTIDLKITAESPIFVRNGHTKKDTDAKNDTYKSFSKAPDGKYFIPATSIKGAIRSVLEIMSFGKMNRVQNRSFGLRDLDDREYRNKMSANKVHCGWLYIEGNSYLLEDCGKPQRVSIEELDDIIKDEFKLNTKLLDLVKDRETFKKNNGRDAILKYKHIFRTQNPNLGKEKFDEEFISSNDYLLSDGSCTLVLTGQPGPRYFDANAKKPLPSKKDLEKYGSKWNVPPGCMKGKGKEFLFPNKIERSVNVDRIIDDFKTIHADTPDYDLFWRKKLMKGEKIPVFFLYEKDGKTVHSMGLSFMYKYPYKQSVYDAIPDMFLDEAPDLSECMFGYIGDGALRGRVQFSSSTPKQETVDREVVVALNSPKPSYYPLYKRGYDWNSDNDIAGRKLYIRWDRTMPKKSDDNDKINSVIRPLKAQSWFESKIRFSNLKPIELGALLAAISFLGDNGKKYKHSLGQGKPYGYGVCKIEVKGGTYFENKDKEYVSKELTLEKQVEYMSSFVSYMNSNFGWSSSEQIKTLFAIAGTRQTPKGDVYMRMSTNRNEDEFLQVKKNGEHLPSIDTKSVVLSDLGRLVESCKKEAIERQQKEREEEERKGKEEEALSKMQSIDKGSVVKVKYLGVKKACIVEPVKIDSEIQIVLSKFEKEPSVGSVFEAIVEQVKKETGKINQLRKK